MNKNIDYLIEINQKATQVFNTWVELLKAQQSSSYKKALFAYYSEQIIPKEKFYMLFNELSFAQAIHSETEIREISDISKMSFAQQIQFNTEKEMAEFVGNKITIESLLKKLS